MFICFYSKPEALSNTVYLNNIMYFGMRSRSEPIGYSWSVTQPMDKLNIIENIIKWMCDEAEIQGRMVNHSVRKTAITTFVHAGIPPTLVQQHSCLN